MNVVDSNPLVGIGLYTPSEAAKLTAMRTARVRRWINGYQYTRGGEEKFSEPLWNSDVLVGDFRQLSFRDLLELKFIRLFHEKARLSLPTIRHALQAAREVIGEERPFSSKRFRTDGKRIFLEISGTANDPQLLDLLKRQYAFKQLIEPSFKNIEFEDNTPTRWWPMSPSSKVVLDPARSFGQPIEPATGVPTSALADAVTVEGSVRLAAKLFEVTEKSVRDAVKFEDALAKGSLAA